MFGYSWTRDWQRGGCASRNFELGEHAPMNAKQAVWASTLSMSISSFLNLFRKKSMVSLTCYFRDNSSVNTILEHRDVLTWVLSPSEGLYLWPRIAIPSMFMLNASMEVAVKDRYTINEKVPPTASNRRKIELAREGDLLTYKRKRKTIDPSTFVPLNIVDTANEGVSELVPPTESAQAALGAQAESAQVPETNSFHFKWGDMTLTQDDVEQLVGLPADGDTTVIGGTWGFPVLLELEKVLSDGTAAAMKKKKKKGLTARSVARTYMMYVLGSFLFPTKKDDDVGIHQKKEASVNEHGDTPVHQSEDVAEQYDTSYHEHVSMSPNVHDTMPTRGEIDGFDQQITTLNDQLQKLKEDKEKEYWSTKIWWKKKTSLGAELRQKYGLEDYNQSLSVELNKKYKEGRSLKVVNALLIEQIDLHLPPSTPPVPNVTLAKKYDDLLSVHEDVNKKLIAKEDFRKKLVNAEERMKSLKVNNSEWEVWRQTLKNALASKGMEDMGDPTFEELFKQNERFFTIQQGPKGDYQEDLVSTAVALGNFVISKREKMAKKKNIQKLVFQPWTKYLVDVRGVEISDSVPEPT
ncbi:hypothetical protein GIB67_016627 [Kingdonia uniflora]|uniref:Aminotransferase-like plant mobile domain-containing protein n=1 Tax=Kingdonia uniflora TaxID=39325 RepID=A0A7J7MZ35_9MAGN|nr:hypothetical protein GIB67_016627 [Kingdonia uniflora]